MSVYAPSQAGQQQPQQPYEQPADQRSCPTQQTYGQPGIASQPWTTTPSLGQQYAQQPAGIAGQAQLPVLITELALRCAATAATAVVEQLRMDPQILLGIQMHGQIPQHAWGTVLVECSRRIAPVLHTTLAPFSQQAPIGQQGFGPAGQFGPPQDLFGQPTGLGM
ncbi:hypothetical protein [Streptomyces violascens]|uniref:hypothetical protein n=1 Tax=Streptomyces violascens TaxID=67381 RepID=UPI0036BAE613